MRQSEVKMPERLCCYSQWPLEDPIFTSAVPRSLQALLAGVKEGHRHGKTEREL